MQQSECNDEDAKNVDEEVEEALPEVLAEADEVIVAGSLFVAGAARAVARDLAGAD